MSTSISTPASLATFTQPHASSSKLPHVSLSAVEGGDGSYAVAAVQGDGVWTYDVSRVGSYHLTTNPRTDAVATNYETNDVIHGTSKYAIRATSYLIPPQIEG